MYLLHVALGTDLEDLKFQDGGSKPVTSVNYMYD